MTVIIIILQVFTNVHVAFCKHYFTSVYYAHL